MDNVTQPIIVIPSWREAAKTGICQPIKETELPIVKTDVLGFLYDIGAVVLNQDKLGFSTFYTNNKTESISGKVSRLLGLVAEGLIVQDCQNNIDNNRKWANYARKLEHEQVDFNSYESQQVNSKFYNALENPDEYIAVGVGFEINRRFLRTYDLYHKTSPRDICWIHRKDSSRNLLRTILNKQKTRNLYAGLQVKVSRGNQGRYIGGAFKNGNAIFQYPLVYFDLGNDFIKIRDKILANDTVSYQPKSFSALLNKSKEDIKIITVKDKHSFLEQNLVRGKDIAPELHEALLEYGFILFKVLQGEIKIEKLGSQVLSDLKIAFGLEYTQQNLIKPSPVITIGS